MAAWPRFKETAPTPITVDGHSGLQVQLTSTNPSSCSSGSLWQTTAGGSMDVYPMINDSGPTAPGTFAIVDTGQGVLVIRTMPLPNGVAADATSRAADQAALRGILSSIRLAASTGSS
jgi:hypothetical protein